MCPGKKDNNHLLVSDRNWRGKNVTEEKKMGTEKRNDRDEGVLGESLIEKKNKSHFRLHEVVETVKRHAPSPMFPAPHRHFTSVPRMPCVMPVALFVGGGVVPSRPRTFGRT